MHLLWKPQISYVGSVRACVCVYVCLSEGLLTFRLAFNTLFKKVTAAGIWSLCVTHKYHSNSKGLWKAIRKRKRGRCFCLPARRAFGTKWFVRLDTKLLTSSWITLRIRPWSKEKLDSHKQTGGQNWPANDSLLSSYHLLEDVRTVTGVTENVEGRKPGEKMHHRELKEFVLLGKYY